MRRCHQGRLVEIAPPPHEIGEEVVNERICQLLLPRFATPWQTLPPEPASLRPHASTTPRTGPGAYADSTVVRSAPVPQTGSNVSCFTPGHEGRGGVGAVTRDHHSGTDQGMNAAKNPVPQARLEDEIWTIEHICTYFTLRPSAAYVKVTQPGFPAPLGGSARFRRWHADQVRSFACEPAPSVAISTPKSSGQLRRRRVAA